MTEDLFYLKLHCAMIEQAVEFARGQNIKSLNAKPWNEKLVRQEAINYVFGPEFEFDMDIAGMDRYIDAVRDNVRRYLPKTYQPTLTNCNVGA